LRHEFPNEWFRFIQPSDQTATSQIMQLELKQERFPFQLRGKAITINDVILFLKLKNGFNYDESVSPLLLSLGIDNTTTDNTTPAMTFKITSSPVKELPFARLSGDSSIIGSGIDTPWKLEVKENDLRGNPTTTSWWQTVTIDSVDHKRLNPKAIEDIWVICDYSAR